MRSEGDVDRAIEILAIVHTKRQFELENAWEEMRAARFPQLPSRRRCLFAFDVASADAALAAGAEMKLTEHAAYEIAPVDAARCRTHLADATWLDHGPGTLPGDQRGERYWRGEMTSNPKPEVLIEGEVRVLRVLT